MSRSTEGAMPPRSVARARTAAGAAPHAARGLRLAALLAGAALLGSCDGANLFEGQDPTGGGGGGAPPEIVELRAASPTVRAGSRLDLRIVAEGSSAISRIDLKMRQAFERDSAITVANPRTSVTQDVSIAVPLATVDTLLVVRVTATDQAGGVSAIAVDTIRVLDQAAPTVTLKLDRSTAAAGDTLALQLKAVDNIALAEVGYVVRRASTGDTIARFSAATRGLERDTVLRYAVPDTLRPLEVDVLGTARDLAGGGSASDPIRISVIDASAPGVTIASPGTDYTVGTGEKVRVQVRLVDLVGVRTVKLQGLALRGDVSLGTAATVPRFNEVTVSLPSPRDTLLTRELTPTADRSSEPVHLVVTATDDAGNARADTLAVMVSRPAVAIVTPSAGGTIELEKTVPVRVSARDTVGIDSVVVSYSGLLSGKRTLAVSPARVLVDDSVLVPVSAADTGSLKLEAVAFSRAGIPGASQAVQVSVVDATRPVVDIGEPVSTPREKTFASDDSVFVRVRLSDNVGLSGVTLEGLAFRGDPDLGTQQVVTRLQQWKIALPGSRDTTLTRYLRPTGDPTSERVFVIVSATDQSGNVGTDTVPVLVGRPRVEILRPATGDVVSSGRSVLVRIRARDQTGISKVHVAYTGAVADTLDFPFSPTATTAEIDTTIFVPAGVSGSLTFNAWAFNSAEVEGRAGQVEVSLQPNATPVDTIRPTVRFTLSGDGNSGRHEKTDSVRAVVEAEDDGGGTGIRRTGVLIRAVNTGRADTVTARVDSSFPVSDARRSTFAVRPFHYDTLTVPDTVIYQVYAFAVDSAGNCAVAAATGTNQSLTCSDTVATAQGTGYQPSGLAAAQYQAVMVRGRTVLLPGGGLISDAVVDEQRDRLYLSNFSRNRIEVFNLGSLSFNASGVLVGSQPWGLFINGPGDTLIVANSGGTNVSFVSLAGTPVEHTARRLLTPNAVLWEVQEKINDAGDKVVTVPAPYDFSDRPQFIAQDAAGFLLYSTVPTDAATQGTLRLVDPNPPAGGQPESYILFNDAALVAEASTTALAHVDFVGAASDTTLVICDHQEGFPSNTFCSPATNLAAAISYMQSAGSDVQAYAQAQWDPDNVGLSDTTFLAASRDRGRVAFGEGATAPTGRIILWDAATQSVSGGIPVADLVNNASERVLGVGLNNDGTLGVARGVNGAYFFTPDLRLQGIVSDPLGAQGAGATFHPLHDTNAVLAETENGFAFVGSAQRSIKLIDAVHFNVQAEIPIRDSIVGPLRARSLTCAAGTPDNECVVVQLYGVSSAGGVVVVDVRRSDLK